MTRAADWRLAPLVATALVAFAGNSLLARAALADPANGAASFAVVRLASGAALLSVFSAFGRFSPLPGRRDAVTVAALVAYALCFSFAYVAMGAATGALILFASVQATIVGIGLWRGGRIGPLASLGLALALPGLVWLLLPGLSAPPLVAAAAMAAAGAAWGIYSNVNSGDGEPVARTTRNFVGAAIAASAVLVVVPFELSAQGWVLALTSGAITSALGYIVWYAVLPRITWLAAASLQLAVPVIAAAGGVALLGEALSLRLVGASVLILGGIALTLRR